MPRKRKKSKESPENIQKTPKRRGKSRPETTTMAQNGGNYGNINNGQYTPQNGGYSPVCQQQQQSQQLAPPMYNPGTPVTQIYSSGANQVPNQPFPSRNDNVLSLILQRLDSVDSKLTQLDKIQSCVSNLTDRMNKIEQKINEFDKKMNDYEQSRIFDSSMMEDIVKKQRDIEKSIEKSKKVETDKQNAENELKNEIQDLKCRSMRDNLLFHKVPEERDEDCVEKILRFIEEKLKIENAVRDIKLQRAHRIGAYNNSKTRPIVAKFAYFPDRERVRRSAKNLSGTPYGISEQFPKDVVDKRRKLVPIMKKARQEGKEAYIKVDKLFINNQLYKEAN